MIKFRFVFSFLVALFFLVAPAHAQAAKSEESSTTFNAIVEFCWARVPNTQELLYDVPGCSAIDLTLKVVGLDFGDDNPVAATMVRDLSKMPIAVGKALHGVEVGGTGLVFQRENVYSQVAKPFGKLMCVIPANKLMGISAETAGEWCNLSGDIPARALVNAGNERQRTKSALSAEEYFVRNFDPAWITNAIFQILPKYFLMVDISHAMGHFKIGSKVVGGVFNAGSSLLGAQLTAGNGVRGNYNALRAQQHMAITSGLAAVGINLAALMAKTFVNTAIMTFPARVVIDVVDKGGPAVSVAILSVYAVRKALGR